MVTLALILCFSLVVSVVVWLAIDKAARLIIEAVMGPEGWL